MHQPSGDNIFTDDNGDSWFQDGPPASTLKAADLNALTHELLNVLKAYGITPKNSGNDTYDQIAQALIARDQGKTREASLVIASSDSDENARLTADIVISTAEDAAAILNAQMVTLSASGGGKIFLRKGNYFINTRVLCRDGIHLCGEGDSSVINRGANNFIGMYTIGDVRCIISDMMLKDVSLDGDYFTGCAFNRITINGSGTFQQVQNLTDCRVIGDPAAYEETAFIVCRNLTNCYSEECSIGFDTCTNLANCYSNGVDSSGYISNASRGFVSCDGLVNCKAEKHTVGFYNCRRAAGCTTLQISGNSASVAYGFLGCDGVTLGYVISCIGAGNVAYKDCHGITLNEAYSNSTAYTSCTPEWASSANAAADTAAGGWNVTT